MYFIGKIDTKKFKAVADSIVTDEVIITNERIRHIKDHHPNDFEEYCHYMREIVSDPDYIIEANKPRSALLLKTFRKGDRYFKTVLRLVTPADNSDFKNSIITFMKINESEWNRLIKNKKILYKSE
ncbi:MAG: PBECR2 nuclease fold domain-containing protein [Bacteroides sp.]|nr:PBECR2 nuclease fold domain-containing protein [Eubacterium sp.]MCM1417500.1 PBECR2 nuclease fold domain-containing protein [Roseburia sp.]MCM1462914.1 PBECR2 nuclease fold domain-containing protein [Bacteroides sp.]